MNGQYRVAVAWLFALMLSPGVADAARPGGAGGFGGGIGASAGPGGFPGGFGNSPASRGAPASEHAADRFSRPGADGLATAAAAINSAASRKANADQQYRAHRDQLDFDSRHQLIVRDEIVVVAPADAASLATFVSQGFSVVRRESLAGIGFEQLVLAPPKGQTIQRALKRLPSTDPELSIDYNHIYFPAAAAVATDAALAPAELRPPPKGEALASPRVGLIDGGVLGQHPALRGVDLHARPCTTGEKPDGRGTAVASVLLNSLGGETSRVSTQLFAADVYCGSAVGGSADAIIKSLDWLAGQGVPVINISLVGPPNATLERVVKLLVARGHLIVAAVGNDGPAAPPLYPAAYQGVIAVTGVDRDNKVLLEAGRGAYVHFAAPGANITAAQLPEGAAAVRGTSFAAPYVAAQLARRLPRADKALADQIVHALEAKAVDLGSPGFDPIFGYGCLGCRVP